MSLDFSGIPELRYDAIPSRAVSHLNPLTRAVSDQSRFTARIIIHAPRCRHAISDGNQRIMKSPPLLIRAMSGGKYPPTALLILGNARAKASAISCAV